MRNRARIVMLVAALLVPALLMPALLGGCGGGSGSGVPPDLLGFVHVGTAANVVGDRTEIDHALLNGDPSKIVIVTAVANPGGGYPRFYPSGQLATQYDAATGLWSIRNLGGSGLVDYAFNVSCWDAGPNAYLHATSAANAVSGLPHASALTHPALDGTLGARLLVTMHIDPGLPAVAAVNAHHVGVYYDALIGQWTVFNQDLVALAQNVGFHVVVLPEGLSDWEHTATAATIPIFNDAVTELNHPNANVAPGGLLQVTAVWATPTTPGGVYYDHIHTLFYEDTAARWFIATELGVTDDMPVNASFFVARDRRTR